MNLVRKRSKRRKKGKLNSHLSAKTSLCSFREKDMNDFLFMLTATLKLAPGSSSSTNRKSEMDLTESTDSSNDSDRTVVYNENSPLPTPPQEQNKASLSWSAADRTMESPLYQTSALHRRSQRTREFVETASS